VQSPGPVPDTFAQATQAGEIHLAHGKDPYFPGWTDTVQLDYRRAATRQGDGRAASDRRRLSATEFVATWPCSNSTTFLPGRGNWLPGPESPRGVLDGSDFRRQGNRGRISCFWRRLLGLEPQLRALGFDYTYDRALHHWFPGMPAAVQGHVLGQPSASPHIFFRIGE